MIVEVNGERTQLADGATVADAVRAAGAEPDARGVAAALRGEVVPKADWGSRRLSEGDELEVVRAVQGG